MRGGKYSLRRRQGRDYLRSEKDVARRTGTHDAPLHRRARQLAGAREGCAGSGCGHRRTDHGVGHGHLRDASGAGYHGGSDWKADRAGRLGGTARSYRTRGHDLLRQSAHQNRHQETGMPRGDSRIRECRFAGGGFDAQGRLQDRGPRGYRRRPLQRKRV